MKNYKLLQEWNGLPVGTIVRIADELAKTAGAALAEYTQEMAVAEQSEIDKKEKKLVDEAAAKASEVRVELVKDAGDNQPEFRNAADFLSAVVAAETKGVVDPRLVSHKATGQSEGVTGDGGYTVTTDLARYITQQMQGESVLARKCSPITIGDRFTGIKIPQSAETARSQTSLYGGVRCYCPGEGVAKTAFKVAIQQKDVQLKVLAAVNYCTEELLQDNTAFESWIRMNVGKALAWTLDNEILNGTLGVCTAVKNALATAEQTFAGNYPTAAEIAGMFKMNLNRSRAEWYMSGDQYGMLIALATTTTGTAIPLFAPDYTKSPSGTLLGRPINVIEQASTATDETAFMFLDLSDYLIIRKGEVNEARSIHVKFLEDEVAFRWTLRVGGAPLQYSKVQLPDGLQYSSLVTRD